MIVNTVRDGRHRQQSSKHEHRAGTHQHITEETTATWRYGVLVRGNTRRDGKHEHRAGPEQEDGADDGEDTAQDLQAVTMQDNGGAEKNGQHEDAHLRVRVCVRARIIQTHETRARTITHTDVHSCTHTHTAQRCTPPRPQTPKESWGCGREQGRAKAGIFPYRARGRGRRS